MAECLIVKDPGQKSPCRAERRGFGEESCVDELSMLRLESSYEGLL